MKTITLEFEAGQNVEILKNSKPFPTRIRAIQYNGSLEVSRDPKTGADTSKVVERIMYSTFADPNTPLPATKIGASREDLMKKVFGAAATPENDESKSPPKK